MHGYIISTLHINPKAVNIRLTEFPLKPALTSADRAKWTLEKPQERPSVIVDRVRIVVTASATACHPFPCDI